MGESYNIHFENSTTNYDFELITIEPLEPIIIDSNKPTYLYFNNTDHKK